MSWLFVCLNKCHLITWKLCVEYIYYKPLLRYGADVNIVDKDRATPLIILASLVNKKCSYDFYDDDKKIYRVQLLLKSGTHLKRTLSGFNALEHHIAFSKNVNKKLSMLLLAAGETTRQRVSCREDAPNHNPRNYV